MRVRNPALAEDLVQETFLAALKARKTFEGQSSERTWLTGILKHKIIDHLRRAHRNVQTDDIEKSADMNAEPFDDRGHWNVSIDNWKDPSASLQQEEFWTALSRCISALPEHLADLFTLREIEEMDSDEVCETLGISTRNNMWVMLSRTRMKLRDCMDKHWFNGLREGGQS
ncbi:MAG: sigma-70 family RNA polymerase sigma factor [Gammaproteobacteria bacterium]|nr:sigma-70 family RNA polymerase sigma factor [Gammaproteobacteria bacterium]